MTVCFAFASAAFFCSWYLVCRSPSAGRLAGGSGSNFNLIHVKLPATQRLGQTDDAQRLVFGPREADFRGHDFPVQAVFAFLAVATVAKFSSDGPNPSKTLLPNW